MRVFTSPGNGWPHSEWLSPALLRGIACVVLLSVLPGVVQAGTIRHDRADSNYTSYAASYPAVGRLTWGSSICSATLIETNWILSAGHCLDASGYTADQWTFNLSDGGGGTYSGVEKFVHPDWTSSGGAIAVGADIALLRLNGHEATVAPAQINADNTDELGRVATHVGYGRSGTGLTGMNTGAGTKRAGVNIVDITGASVSGFNDKVLFEDFDSGTTSDNWSGTSARLSLEYLIASGDSGGPMFMDFGSGEVVSGVHSFISSVDGVTDADYGDISGSTRVSSYASWISTTIAANDPIAPEPATLVVWLLIGGALGGRHGWQRRRRRADVAGP